MRDADPQSRHRRLVGPARTLKGMILAAGYGKRFRPLTLHRAKPSIPFLNRPVIEYSLELFRGLGVQDLVINLHHAPESVTSSVDRHLSEKAEGWRPRVAYSRETVLLGTAGAIGKARELLQGADILLSNGKIFFEDDLSRAVQQHQSEDAWVTLVLVPHGGQEPYNPVVLDRDGTVVAFPLKSGMTRFDDAYIFTGVHLISDRVLPFIPEGCSDSVRDLYPALMKRGHPIRGFVSREFWCECSWPRRYLENTLSVMRRTGRANWIAEPLEADMTGVVAAPNVRVGSDCRLRNVVLMEGVSVGPESSLSNVIICTGSDLPAGTDLVDGVVTPAFEDVPKDMAGEVKLGPGGGYLVWPLK